MSVLSSHPHRASRAFPPSVRQSSTSRSDKLNFFSFFFWRHRVRHCLCRRILAACSGVRNKNCGGLPGLEPRAWFGMRRKMPNVECRAWQAARSLDVLSWVAHFLAMPLAVERQKKRGSTSQVMPQFQNGEMIGVCVYCPIPPRLSAHAVPRKAPNTCAFVIVALKTNGSSSLTAVTATGSHTPNV